jgi:hypothetical protein
MAIWRTIIVHTLAANLLMVGVCPCSLPNVAAGKSNGRTTAAASPSRPAACCCTGMCDGKKCGMPCCRRAADQRPVPPAAPDHKGTENQEPAVAVFGAAAPLLNQSGAALLRASQEFGGDAATALTLQTQSVRIQT